MILATEVKTTWNARNKAHYISKGYVFSFFGDIIQVKVVDLQDTSSVRIKVKCDYQQEDCKNIYTTKYKNIAKNHIHSSDKIYKDCCDNPNCMKIKRAESLLLKYGVSNSNQIPDAQQKRKDTCVELYGNISPLGNEKVKEKSRETLIERYGVTNISQVDEIKDKKAETTFKNHGVENPLQSKVIQAKSKKTMIERYGVDNFTKTDEYKVKTKKTNLKRYGKEWSLQNKEIRFKINKTMYENGTSPCSSQQRYIYTIIGGELNFPIGRSMLDIAFPKEMIYFEYDGGGHDMCVKMGNASIKEFNIKEMKRRYFLRSMGWREIRIISKKDRLPDQNTIENILQYAKDYLNSGRSWIYFDIDENQVSCSQFEETYNFNELLNANEIRSLMTL